MGAVGAKGKGWWVKMAAHLSYGRVNLNVLREAVRRELREFLDKCAGSKVRDGRQPHLPRLSCSGLASSGPRPCTGLPGASWVCRRRPPGRRADTHAPKSARPRDCLVTTE